MNGKLKNDQKAKRGNDIKWQLNGVLDDYLLPRKNAAENSFGFKDNSGEGKTMLFTWMLSTKRAWPAETTSSEPSTTSGTD